MKDIPKCPLRTIFRRPVNAEEADAEEQAHVSADVGDEAVHFVENVLLLHLSRAVQNPEFEVQLAGYLASGRICGLGDHRVRVEA